MYYSVFKDRGTEVYYLSPASITREVSGHKLDELAKGYTSCTNKENMCMACSLFGMLNDKIPVASRVRMTDMTVDTDETNYANLYENPITLQELSGPKLQNVEFYLKRPENAWLWTYDYFVDKNGNVHTYSAELSGRKFYWHNSGMKLADAKAKEKNNRNVTVRPVKRDVVFHGKLFFDGITKKELDSLIYLINAGEDCDTALAVKKHGYKLGHAKPLGLGSVALHADCVKLRTLEKDENKKCVTYNVAEYDLQSKEAGNVDNNSYNKDAVEADYQDVLDNFSTMTDFNALNSKLADGRSDSNAGYTYSYPHSDTVDDEVFKWFVANHKYYRTDKVSGKKKSANRANKRNFQYFDQYMEPMKPVLQSSGADQEVDGNYNSGGNPRYSRYNNGNHVSSKNNSRGQQNRNQGKRK